MKTCGTCNTEKPFSAFNKNATKKDGLQTLCRECSAKISHTYYKGNKEKHISVVNERNSRMKAANKAYALEYLQTHPCVNCNNKDYRVLDFDHVRGVKRMNVAALLAGGYSLDTLKAEIAKCEIRCKNCHAIVTYERLGSVDWRSKGMLLLEI